MSLGKKEKRRIAELKNPKPNQDSRRFEEISFQDSDSGDEVGRLGPIRRVEIAFNEQPSPFGICREFILFRKLIDAESDTLDTKDMRNAEILSMPGVNDECFFEACALARSTTVQSEKNQFKALLGSFDTLQSNMIYYC